MPRGEFRAGSRALMVSLMVRAFNFRNGQRADGWSMIKQLLNANRRRVPVKYAVIAAALAVASVLALEAAGTALTNSYTGLGGKLTPGSDGAADIAPAKVPASSSALR